MNLAILHQLVKYIGLEDVENELNAIAAKGFDDRYIELYEALIYCKNNVEVKQAKASPNITHWSPEEYVALKEAIQKLKDYEHNRQSTKKPTYEAESLCFARQRLRGLRHKLDEVLQDIKEVQSMIDVSGKANDSIQGLLTKATKYSEKAKSNVGAVFLMLNKE